MFSFQKTTILHQFCTIILSGVFRNCSFNEKLSGIYSFLAALPNTNSEYKNLVLRQQRTFVPEHEVKKISRHWLLVVDKILVET